MEIFRTTVTILLIISALLNLMLMLKHDIHMLQQNSYRNERYWKWLKMSDDFSAMPRLVVIAILAMLCSFMFTWSQIIAVIVLTISIITALRKKYKKPLVFTKRVYRLIAGCAVAIATIVAASFFANAEAAAKVILLLSAISYLIVLVVNRILKPVENAINNSYISDAKKRLAQMSDMKIIGITGSYGKTSTKHYLSRILSESYNVLMTPGSYNTPMGVVRTVREMMEPYHNVFIVEMGAKNIGDIKEICNIVHPQYGIITAVGEQHLESFKSIENVQKTKFELVDALPADGLAILNNDFEYVRNREVNNVAALRYAVSNTTGADYTATDITYTPNGTDFSVLETSTGTKMPFHTKLIGESNISNLLGAIVLALKIGVPVTNIKYAVEKIEPVKHRLSITRTAGGVTILDDAFNSNPDGSRMALDVLSTMTQGKRIIITPGMIELGEKQQEYNYNFGCKIAKSCDIAIVVGEYNRESITSGIKDGMKEGDSNLQLLTADTFNEAQAMLHTFMTAGDTVLYENDLPDTFK